MRSLILRVGGGGGEGGGTGNNFGKGVQVSILKPNPIIYLAFEKNRLFIYLISQKVDLFRCCSLNLSPVTCKQFTNDPRLNINVNTKA